MELLRWAGRADTDIAVGAEIEPGIGIVLDKRQTSSGYANVRSVVVVNRPFNSATIQRTAAGRIVKNNAAVPAGGRHFRRTIHDQPFAVSRTSGINSTVPINRQLS